MENKDKNPTDDAEDKNNYFMDALRYKVTIPVREKYFLHFDSLSFQNEFNDISPKDLEEILEFLEDSNYLSDNGKNFRKEFWEMFIKKEDKTNNNV